MTELASSYTSEAQYINAFKWCRDLLCTGDANEVKPRSFKGPLFDEIQDVLLTTSEMLHIIHPDLEEIYLQPSGYITERGVIKNKYGLLNALEDNERIDFYELQSNYRLWLGAVGYLYAKRIEDTVEIPLNLLSDTPFIKQSNGGRTCAMQCFAMITEAISGLHIPQHVMENMVCKIIGNEIVDFDFYIKALCSDFIEQECGVTVTPITVTGATLGYINELVTKIKAGFINSQVFCTVPIRSDKYDDYWHQVVLLGDDANFVYCNNPGGQTPMPNQVIEKLEFYERWANCLSIAHLFVVQEKN